MMTTLIDQNTSTFENHLPILKFGVCSWTDSTLIACGRFYPKTFKTNSERLSFYSTQFPCVEVDSSNYAIPPPHRVEKWVKVKHFVLFDFFKSIDNRMTGTH
jgi:uncharacterized protein YecE (DUF72 family)